MIFFSLLCREKKEIILINLLEFPQGVQDLSPWKEQHSVMTQSFDPEVENLCLELNAPDGF